MSSSELPFQELIQARFLLSILLGITVTGFVLSCAVHFSALIQTTNPLGEASLFLQVPGMVVFAVCVSAGSSYALTGQTFLEAYPEWGSWLTKCLIVYTIAISLLDRWLSSKEKKSDTETSDRTWSAIMLSLYSISAVILYTFLNQLDLN